MGRYDDLMGRERPQYERHPPMARKNRAAQFAPFAALRGFDDSIAEAGRRTETRPQLDEQAMEELDRLLRQLLQELPARPEVIAEYFVPDAYKQGGSIRTHRGTVCRLDAQSLLFSDGTLLRVDQLLNINCNFGEIML